MKASYLAVAVVGLTLGGLWYFAGGAQPPQAQAAEPRVSAPLSHENLTVYFVHGQNDLPNTRVLTLQEALDCGWAIVHETGDVNELVIENRAIDYDLFVQSGDVVKGGRQDRLIASDMLLPPASGLVPVRVHCVEQGRWTGRSNDRADRFGKCDNFAIGNDIKLANAYRDQGKVWENVKAGQQKLSANLGTQVNAAESPSSLQLALEHPAVQAKVAEYESVLRPAGEGRSGVVGVVFAVNGRVSGAEVYGSGVLFQKAWPKLLRAAASEAVMEKTDTRTLTPPSAREVELFLANAEKPEPTEKTNADGSVVIDAEEILVDSRDNVVGNRGGRGFNGRSGSTREEPQRESGGVNISGNTINEVQRARNPGNNDFPQSQTLAPDAPAGRAANPVDNVPALPALPVTEAAPRQPASQAAQPARLNPDGNRLNTNRVDNRSTLLLESRDAVQPGVVIHKSYLRK